MSGKLPAPCGWTRVSRQSPCPVCSKPDWCTISNDGVTVCCMRVESQRQLKNGGWLHHLADRPSRAITPIHLAGPGTRLAPVDQRDRVYRALVRELGLLPRHQDHLLHARGLPASMLECFASAPPQNPNRLRKIAACVTDRLGNRDALGGVPGFLVDRDGRWTCRGTSPGILIPVPDPAGLIQGFQVRFDRCSPAGARYNWYSSRGRPGGCSSGTPVATWRPVRTFSRWIIVTEGSLKAAIASWHLRALVIGLPGVSSWARALNLLPKDSGVVVAFDADAVTNPHVARHQRDLARALFWSGHDIAIADWLPQCKGIDDAILAGESIELTSWPGSSGSVPLQEQSPPEETSAAEARK